MLFYAAVLAIFVGIFSTGNSQNGPPGINNHRYPAPQPGPPGASLPYEPGPPGMNLDEAGLEYPNIPHDAGIPDSMGGQGEEIMLPSNHVYSDPRGPISYNGVPIAELRWRHIMERRRRLNKH